MNKKTTLISLTLLTTLFLTSCASSETLTEESVNKRIDTITCDLGKETEPISDDTVKPFKELKKDLTEHGEKIENVDKAITYIDSVIESLTLEKGNSLSDDVKIELQKYC